MLVLLATVALAFVSSGKADQPLTITPLAEKKISELPKGEMFWRIENFPSAEAARAAASPWSLVAESAGKVWLFTLGPAGGATPGGTKVDEVGPIPRPEAKEFLLRINQATGPRGAITPVHSHPGSEAFYVLSGEQFIRNAHKSMTVKAGETEPGCGADMAMQVSSVGKEDLHALVMFVVDANRPFSPPAEFPEN